MERHYGTEGIALIECINPRLGKYRVRWDVRPYSGGDSDGRPEESHQVSFVEKEFNWKPTLSEVKETILSWYNTVIDRRIMEGFSWNGASVWLSSENQFNYKAAYDIAVQTGGANLPLTFKFGSTEDPVYYVFRTMEELTNFYLASAKYVSDTLEAGWIEKDGIDFSDYQAALEAL